MSAAPGASTTCFVPGPVTVSVPATSANLGPGFDALGLALDHRDEVTAEVVEGPGPEITVEGTGAGVVPLDDRHLVHRALCAALERIGVEVPTLRLHCRNVIPHARGLGSSSAAIVAGVCLARELVAGGREALDDEGVLALAAELEGHADNVAAAFLGGFTVAWSESGRWRAVSLEVSAAVHPVVLVPTEAVHTSVARGLLPATVPHGDAAETAGRAALLVAALGGRPELLLAATQDRLHQEYREPAMPASLQVVRRLRADGWAAMVSGAGPSVLVLTDEASRSSVADRAPQGWEALVVPIDRHGARVAAGARTTGTHGPHGGAAGASRRS